MTLQISFFKPDYILTKKKTSSRFKSEINFPIY